VTKVTKKLLQNEWEIIEFGGKLLKLLEKNENYWKFIENKANG